MCIIAYKEKNTSCKIDWEIMQTMFANNPDGAGYSIAYNGRLILRKGFMRYEDFKQSFEKTTQGVDIKKSAILLHFRITTHGGTYKENCHPFPIGGADITGQKYKDLKAVVAMNGVCLSNADSGYYSKYTGKPKQGRTNSDTMDVVENLINPLYAMSGAFWRKKETTQILNWLGAKWVFLEKDGTITTHGEFNSHKGWNYSNFSWLAVKAKTTTDSCTVYGWGDYYTGYGYGYDDGMDAFTGVIVNSKTGERMTCDKYSEIYLDESGDLWRYDWEIDDYEYLQNWIVGGGN